MFDTGMEDRYTTAARLIDCLAACRREVGRSERTSLAYVAACDDAKVWRDDDCHNMAHWLSINFGLQASRAARMVAAAHALKSLPRIAAALEDGSLSFDKVLELCRFATSEEEAKLLAWVQRKSVAAIRDEAEVRSRIAKDEVRNAERARRLTWWNYDDGMWGLYACLPPDKGAAVQKALEREANRLPDTPEDDADPGLRLDQRRADALVTLASAAIADDADPDRATVVVHVPVRTLSHGDQNGVLEGGAVIAPEVARGLCCDSRMQFVFENEAGRPVRIGYTSRELPPRLSRILRRRDGDRCCFPGCGNRRFLKAHHIDWWGMERKTLLDKLLLVCPAHHDLIHKHHWNVRLKGGVEPQWFRPDGRLFVPGPSP